jgi:SAM-dependent methyltransferase
VTDTKANDNSTRFEFGKNWTAFLSTVDEARIAFAIASLSHMLGTRRLDGKTFLDIGCGSGLSSLAALRMGATVCSFDYDAQSVACSQELKRRFASDDATWKIETGSALDEEYLASLGKFDIVYSWGVLHHTGQMVRAIELASERVANAGDLFIALYHDQGAASRRWALIKRTYHRLPSFLQPVWVVAIAAVYELKFAAARLARGKNPLPFADWRQKANDRGMSVWYDWVDWIGGWPFEVATPDQVINPMNDRGFCLRKIKTVGNGWGCNEFVFRRDALREF